MARARCPAPELGRAIAIEDTREIGRCAARNRGKRARGDIRLYISDPALAAAAASSDRINWRRSMVGWLIMAGFS
jgi:hypothetical protein